MKKAVKLAIPLPPKAKARPRVTKNGTFMPKPYMKWKAELAELIDDVKKLTGTVGMDVVFYKDRMDVVVSEVDMQRFGQADIDNLIGGLMDALQDAGVFENDRQVVAVKAMFVRED